MCMLHSDLHAVLQTLVGLMMQLCKRSGRGLGTPGHPKTLNLQIIKSLLGPPVAQSLINLMKSAIWQMEPYNNNDHPVGQSGSLWGQ